jgi:hypothetical protein
MNTNAFDQQHGMNTNAFDQQHGMNTNAFDQQHDPNVLLHHHQPRHDAKPSPFTDAINQFGDNLDSHRDMNSHHRDAAQTQGHPTTSHRDYQHYAEPSFPEIGDGPLAGDGSRSHGGHSHASTQPWQERYGRSWERDNYSSPKPYHSGGTVDASGIKSWQLSHLRGLEVKGYQVKEQERGNVELVADSEIGSYTPFLVSDKTKAVDRLKTYQDASGEYSSISPSGFKQRTGRSPGFESPMPYCDL